LAEETGLILPIGEWVLQESCRQRRLWLEQFPEQSSFSISVNLSAKQFIQKDLVGGVLGHLKEHRLQPEHMNLEITESVVMENFDAARQILGQLKNEHIHLHLDDFGTGYSSLSQLHRFPLDVLKIDQSFVKRMTGGDEGIVRTIITLAHELGMGMIAEGVETAESFEKLKSLKCTEAQGYFFAKPLEPLVAEELLTAGTRWGAHG
jgi:EAL domain-containing protein (putative c-di-GMP-specific phosphodiesterase class I)